MEKRPLGKSGMHVAPVALGGNVFGWTADEKTSFAILDAFVDAGGTMIDTADVYSFWAPGHQGGESETVIGKWLKASGKRDKVHIATKVGFIAGLAPDVVLAACDASLARLGIERIDLYYQHKDDQAVPLRDAAPGFVSPPALVHVALSSEVNSETGRPGVNARREGNAILTSFENAACGSDVS
jgi:aryl-alcohol dehydrogenase-like predicted oxidoreductase